MFDYLRYFLVISVTVVVLAAYGAGVYFKSIAAEDLEELVDKNNVALAQGYINSTWKKHHSVLVRLSRVDVEKWQNYWEFRRFVDETNDYFEEMPVLEANIYTGSGELILSTSKKREKLTNPQRQAIRESLAGKPFSRIIENRVFVSADGSKKIGAAIQTYVPILSDYFVPVVADGQSNKAEAVVEVFYDITSQWEKQRVFQLVAATAIILIFMLLLSMLFITARRAEGIITRQVELNLELTAAAAAAEAENRDKSQFLANISHELRTPLNAIIGFSEIIKNEALVDLNHRYQEYIKDIHSSGVHLLSLINDILDFSKAEAGKLEVNISEIDAVKMVKNCMRLMIPRAEQASIALLDDLPRKHFTLQTDAKKLKQVLLNLLSNAVKFTPSGGQVKVVVLHDEVEDSVTFEVHDTGIGISPKDMSRVMMPFGQVDSTLARKYEGTGLGLPLSKKFVEVLGGRFNMLSEVNVGTTVSITLPRQHHRERT